MKDSLLSALISRLNDMSIFLAIFTYFAYIFIITMYTVKIVKYLRLPVHLRWDLYPVIHEERYKYGGSYFEDIEWWTKARQKRFLRGLIYLLKEYLYLGEYFKRHKSYWLVLYPWHIGFILIITFHILCFLGAIAEVIGVNIFYYLTIVIGVVSFTTGVFGSIGLIIKRLTDKDLKTYASPLTYFNYIFTLAVFLSGLYAWYFVDPTFSEYREFWKGLITFHFTGIEPAGEVHIIIFALFLIYLPYTRSMHYISRLFAFFLIRWDDEPNTKGSELEKKLQEQLKWKVTWSAPHIKSGKTWGENAKK